MYRSRRADNLKMLPPGNNLADRTGNPVGRTANLNGVIETSMSTSSVNLRGPGVGEGSFKRVLSLWDLVCSGSRS
jgi:hypothetical protein